ncbi:MAG: BamA/TamA family outer membrane protein [Gammaproteobacteria bacterium]|nr:BamA/TamA family outer membrane protein [Gammaproteobacteria bacterium]MCW9004599.1 BamA/TamA family outer membrane protein [Gammaproteobacteria bacterium]
MGWIFVKADMASIGKKLLLIILVFSAVSVDAASLINQIRFEGNDVTRESLLRKEILVSEGDELDGNKILASVQSIMDLGLFRSVDYYLESSGDAGVEDQEVMDLVFVLKEKYYLIIIPQSRTEDNEIHLGVQLRWDNIGGLNHQLKLVAINHGKTSGIREKNLQVKYADPFIFDSDYNFGISLAENNSVTENLLTEDENVINQSLQFSVSKFLDRSRGSRGYFLGLGINFRSRQFKGVSSGLMLDETDATSLSIHWGFEDVHDYLYNRGGKEFGYSAEFSHHALGSLSEFVIHNVYYRSYYRFASRPDDNLNVQTIFSYATDYVLNEYAFALGGSDDLRGYDKNRFEGNAQLLMNIEYLTPDNEHKRLRYAVFLDVGNTYETVHDIKEGALNTTAGFGVRWKIPIFVNLDLRLDAGYGFTDDDYRISFSSKQAF